MKEIENINKDQIEIVQQEQEKKQEKIIGQQRVIKGLTLWEIDFEEQTYKKVEYQKETLQLTSLDNPDLKKNLKVKTKDSCIYIQKLNEKSLLKYLKKTFGNIEFKRFEDVNTSPERDT